MTYGLEGRCSIHLSYGQCGKLERYKKSLQNEKRVVNDNPFFLLVGVQGFEPWTPWSQTRCATGLRHTPKSAIIPQAKQTSQNFVASSAIPSQAGSITAARRVATLCASCASRASTITRISGSVPEARISTRPAPTNSASARSFSAIKAVLFCQS